MDETSTWRTSTDPARAAARPAGSGTPLIDWSSAGPTSPPSGRTMSASVPDASPPKPGPSTNRSGICPGSWSSRSSPLARAARMSVPRDASDPETAAYSAAPSSTRMSSVSPPLHARRRSRVRRSSVASPFSRGSSAATQAVPHPANRLDAGCAVRPELLAKEVDIRLDGVRCERGPVRPRVVEQLVAAQDLPRPAQEALQDRVLAATELNLRAAHRHPAQRLVENDRPGAEPHGRARRRSPAQRPEPCEQLLVRERLHEVVVRPGVQAGNPVPDRVAGREHQDRHRVAGPAELPRDLEPGAVRAAPVEYDGVEARRGAGDLDALVGRPGRLHRVAVLRQEPPQEPDEPDVILDDQQVHEISSAREGAFVGWVPSGRDERDVPGRGSQSVAACSRGRRHVRVTRSFVGATIGPILRGLNGSPPSLAAYDQRRGSVGEPRTAHQRGHGRPPGWTLHAGPRSTRRWRARAPILSPCQSSPARNDRRPAPGGPAECLVPRRRSAASRHLSLIHISEPTRPY